MMWLQKQRDWPHRYQVTVSWHDSERDRQDTVNVLTWLYDEKAVALAVQAVTRGKPDAQVYDAKAENLGRADSKEEEGGVVKIEDDDLFDRMEF